MRLLYTTLLFIHLIGVALWVGGMFVMHFAVRPAAAGLLPPPQRLPLLVAVLGRFFFWVSIAIAAILASGIGLMLGAGGFANAHLSVHLMAAIGIVMTAIYLHIRFAPFPRLQRAVAASDWPTAASNLDLIRKLVATNLALGIATTGVATIGRALL
jgi:uncharacterized membrane protein